MSNITITPCDVGPVLLGDNQSRSGNLTGTTTQAFLAGTILARQFISPTITAVLTGTGTHVLTPTAVAGKTPKVGAYTLVAGTLAAGVGIWTLTDPDGDSQIITTVSKTAAMPFPNLGITISPAAAGTDFVTTDSAAITVAASTTFPFVEWSATGSNGGQTPVAVLPYAVTLAAGTAPIDACVSGRVNATRLIIAADGTGANVTAHVEDMLRQTGIVPIPVEQLSARDNH